MQDSELIKWIEQMRDKHGKAAGTPYEEGQWDMAQRILSRLGYGQYKRNMVKRDNDLTDEIEAMMDEEE